MESFCDFAEQMIQHICDNYEDGEAGEGKATTKQVRVIYYSYNGRNHNVKLVLSI